MLIEQAVSVDLWQDANLFVRVSHKMERLALLLNGALEARYKVGLKLNLPDHKLEAMLHALPSLRRPTISQLAGGGWVAVETIIDESVVREIIPQLKSLGAEGIIEYPLNKVVH